MLLAPLCKGSCRLCRLRDCQFRISLRVIPKNAIYFILAHPSRKSIVIVVVNSILIALELYTNIKLAVGVSSCTVTKKVDKLRHSLRLFSRDSLKRLLKLICLQCALNSAIGKEICNFLIKRLCGKSTPAIDSQRLRYRRDFFRARLLNKSVQIHLTCQSLTCKRSLLELVCIHHKMPGEVCNRKTTQDIVRFNSLKNRLWARFVISCG